MTPQDIEKIREEWAKKYPAFSKGNTHWDTLGEWWIAKLEQSYQKGYSLGKSAGTYEECERWGKEIVPAIKEQSYDKGFDDASKAMKHILEED
jgi:hypothetical protein